MRYFLQDGKSKKSSLSLYSGMSDIISESVPSGLCSSPSSCSSTPSSPSKIAQGGTPRLQTFTSSMVFKSGGGGLLVHHPVTPKKRVITKTKTDHLSDELNLGYRQVTSVFRWSNIGFTLLLSRKTCLLVYL